MKILVIGGTRFFGIHMVYVLLEKGHEVTIATRGQAKDPFGDKVSRILLDHSNPESIKRALAGKHFDVAIDKIAYCSNDIKYLMDAVSCDRLIYMSSTAVYNLDHMDVKEDEFDGKAGLLKWCNRPDASYAEVKRQAEYALWQEYGDGKWLAVRYPFVVGKDDYTKRLLFYVEHVMKGIPMQIDNLDAQMSFIRSDEAGRFLAFLAETEMTGAVNGCGGGTVSIREILNYVEEKTGKTAVLSVNGEAAPYNGTVGYSINTEKAQKIGYQFSNVRDWMFELVDEYIKMCVEEK
ncbi:MAG: NAD-dependent epimerase/dehydratase family protein [Lachnospiraceae bacterium]|nr:NAD-dependent epimerase/dehydratase family protein [Lachnospiraceae bacterium]